ncbi:MAG: 4Fe-4S binding protein [Woeseiaceae bacterium]|nr:4Fe-4S binding protein [Woeseiaceae bacterium]
MASLRDRAIQWYGRTFGAPTGSDVRDEGFTTVLDGITAVHVSESAISSHTVDAAEGPRGLVAEASGLALAGRRSTAFLSGQDLAAVQDLLVAAAGKHAPLVLHVESQSAAAHGGALGSGHDTVHLAADSGCFLLFACNVQQAIDFAFIARRVSEETLVPGLVVMDSDQTAHAVQDARLLSPNQVSRFIGSARDEVESPTAAQKLLFGETRRRLPIWHDLDEPMLTGAVFERDSYALGAAARRPFFDRFVGESLSHAFADFERTTGRRHDAISRHRLDGAKLALVAQGAAIETAMLTADVLRREHDLRVGVLGLSALRPFPADAIAESLGQADAVIVLERCDATLSSDPPLTREVRSSLYRNDRRPVCRTAVYGVGGLPLRVGDLIALCTGGTSKHSEPVFVGIAFDDDTSDRPKREVLLDALRRAYPDAAGLGVRAPGGSVAPRQKNALSVAVRNADEDMPLASSAAALMHALEGGRVRSRAGPQAEWFVHGDKRLLDPGDRVIADITLDAARRTITLHESARHFVIANGESTIDVLLGGLFAALVEGGFLEAKTRRIAGMRREMLDSLDAQQRETKTDDFRRGWESLSEERVPSTTTRSDGADMTVPAAVRDLGRSDDRVASLPRFWDQAGILYRDNETDRLTADPFFATGSMPPLSATFSRAVQTREWLPGFNPESCTGCGRCWTHCPDSAIGVTATGPAALIDAGIRETGAEAVRRVAGKLASRILASCRKAESAPAHFGEMLDDAFAWLCEKAPWPDDRKQAIEDGVGKIRAAFGDLPVAVTKPFFHDAETRKKDSGELLSIVINPDACQACGICTKVCEPDALHASPAGADVFDGARALWDMWSATPDTPGGSIDVAADSEEVGPAAAMLLSRYCQFAMAGSDIGEAGSGEKAAVRLALAAIEYRQQPIVQRFANELTDAGAALAGLIRETLSGTLPVDDFDAVAEQLESLASPRVDLSTLAGTIGNADADRSVETAYLLRLIELSKDVAAACHRIVKGEHGLGRARYGLAITRDTANSWAGRFPANPFQVPAVIDLCGNAPRLAAGLIEGHLAETAELVRLLRLARLEVERPDGLEFKREALMSLRWQDLADEELDLCPPLLLIGSEDTLAGSGLAQLMSLLGTGLPIKVLVLSDLDCSSIGLLALVQRDAYVAQTSIAFADHFALCLDQALSFRGAALVQVCAPSPARGGFDPADTIEQAQLTVSSRVLPLFRYDPRAEGVFGSRISLEGNPDDDGAMVTEQRLADWQTLLELAGEVTPFTEKVEARIRREVAAEHQAELQAQQEASAGDLAAIREKTRADIARKLRSRLLELATRRRDT